MYVCMYGLNPILSAGWVALAVVELAGWTIFLSESRVVLLRFCTYVWPNFEFSCFKESSRITPPRLGHCIFRNGADGQKIATQVSMPKGNFVVMLIWQCGIVSVCPMHYFCNVQLCVPKFHDSAPSTQEMSKCRVLYMPIVTTQKKQSRKR